MMLTEIFNVNTYAFSIYGIPVIITTLASLALGLSVIIREKASPVSLAFFLMTLSITIWLFCFTWMYWARTPEVGLWWAKAAYLAVPFIPTVIYQFTVATLRIYQQRKLLVWGSWILSTAFSLVIITTPALINEVHKFWWGYYPSYNWLSIPYLCFFFGMLIASLIEYCQEYRKTRVNSNQFYRIRLYLIAFCTVYLGCVDFLAKFGIPVYPFGYLAILSFLVIIAYTIIRYRLVDITPSFAANQILDTIADPLIVCDAEDRIQVVNHIACKTFGYTEKELIGKSISCLIDSSLSTANLFNRLLHADIIRDEDFLFQTKTGELIDVSLSISKLWDPSHHTTLGHVILARDIRQYKKMTMQLAYLASHDALTGLFNRRYFEEELDKQIKQSQRMNIKGALLWLDVDSFKEINDGFGHRAGDKVLIDLAQLLQETLRKTDIIARLGGDEFAIILPNTNQAKTTAIADKLLKTILQHKFLIQGNAINITISAGITLFPDHSCTKEDLLTYADIAMYKAKEEGRNCFRFYQANPQWQAPFASKLTLAQQIRKALDENSFTLYAQPIIDLNTNEISYFELLLRIVNDDGKLVYPRTFLEIAERYGLMQNINRWVIEHVFEAIIDLQQRGFKTSFTCNFSGNALSDTVLMEKIKVIANQYPTAANSLVIEITETAIISNLNHASVFIKACKNLGLRFALDDFGVGLSSFSHLKHLAIDFIKIDGSFIRNLVNDSIDQSLVKAIADTARALNKQTIAEFVNSQETVAMLRKLGVNYGQGYYLGTPLPLQESTNLMLTKKS